ncbi:MAG: ABC transporter permease [Spirochaetaceae bacterium]
MGEAFLEALRLIRELDGELISVTMNSLRFSLASTALGGALGVPAAVLLAFGRFPGRRGLIAVAHALMALPTVVIGLFVYSLLSRSGPFGGFDLLFTPAAVVTGQSILALPIVTSLTYGAVSGVEDELRETLITLGASGPRVVWKTFLEARIGIATALLSAFGRVIGEVGIAMMLGGNIRWYTRTMTTALALETQRGAFSLALAMGIVLLAVALGVNLVINWTVHRAA